jgi:hypothetical protein
MVQLETAGCNIMRLSGLILAVVLACGLAPQASGQLKFVSKEKLKSVNAPTLSRDSASLNFETRHIVAEPMTEDDAPRSYIFEFTNVGRGKLEIKRLVSTCSCVQAVCLNREVAPGEKAEIKVTYNPKGHPGKFERKIFVYTQDGDTPSAVLRLSVDVENSLDIAGQYPVSMGKIRLRRTAVRFKEGQDAVEKLRFVNVSGRVLRFDCDRAFLPECIKFYAPPTRPLEEAEMVVRYDSTKPGAREKLTIFLNELGLPPSQSSLTVYFD